MLTLALLGGLSYQSLRAYRQLAANRTLLQAESLGAEMVQTGRRDRRLVEPLLVQLEKARAHAPADPRIPLAAGSFYSILGDPTVAVRRYRQALEIEPRPEIYFNLGRALWLLSETEDALVAFRAATRLDPSWLAAVPAELRSQL